MQDILKKYLDLLDSAEDYVEGGWSSGHGNAGDLKLSLSGEIAAGGTGDRGRTGAIGRTSDRDRTGSGVSDTLEAIAAEVKACGKCRLGSERKNPVPGEGVLNPKVMIIGEAPGAQEDACGHPFVGRAGQYLDKWLHAIGLDRERDVFIGNIIKCRPPKNRDPLPDESAACMPYLKRQIALINPRVILTLGRISTHLLTGTTEGIGKLHGRVLQFEGVPLIPTYHPSGVLRNPVYRQPVWDDLRKLKRTIEAREREG